jgi:hypothetical protein
MVKSRRLKSAKQVARMGTNRNAYKVSVGNAKGKRSLDRSNGRWFLEKQDEMIFSLRIGTSGGRL